MCIDNLNLIVCYHHISCSFSSHFNFLIYIELKLFLYSINLIPYSPFFLLPVKIYFLYQLFLPTICLLFCLLFAATRSFALISDHLLLLPAHFRSKSWLPFWDHKSHILLETDESYSINITERFILLASKSQIPNRYASGLEGIFVCFLNIKSVDFLSKRFIESLIKLFIYHNCL